MPTIVTPPIVHSSPLSPALLLFAPPPPAPPPPPLHEEYDDEVSNSSNKARLFHWDTLPPSKTKKTFWKMSNVNLLNIKGWDEIEKELKKLFEIKSTTNLKFKKPKHVSTLVSLSKANNAAIVLKYISKYFETEEQCLDVVISALIKLRKNMISIEQIKTFSSLFPLSKAEIFALQEFNKNNDETTTLSLADKFYTRAIRLPRLKQRLECCAIRRTFTIETTNIRRSCVVIQNACIELKESIRFKKILNTVLIIGTALNKGTHYDTKIGITGFKLKTLSKLKETKTQSRDMSLFDYFINRLKKEDENTANFSHNLENFEIGLDDKLMRIKEELPSLQNATKISFKELRSQYYKLIDNCQFFECELKKVQEMAILTNNSDPNTIYYKTFAGFNEHSTNKLKTLKVKIEKTEMLLRKVMTYYGEDYSDISSDEFFGIINKFIEDIDARNQD
jgi:hypothetical protein